MSVVSSQFLELYCTRLGHGDVTSNMGPPLTCEEYNLQKEVSALRVCDGTYPANVGRPFLPAVRMVRNTLLPCLFLCTPFSTKPRARRSGGGVFKMSSPGVFTAARLHSG